MKLINLIKKLFNKPQKSIRSQSETAAKEIFDNLKDSRTVSDDASLDAFEKNCALQIEKFKATGQTEALKRVEFIKSHIEKERALIKIGINSFIYMDDIYDFISRDEIKTAGIKIIELSRYTRAIPDDIQKKVEQSKDIFDNFYVLFTDYTGKLEREQIRKEVILRKEKDPILFGTFEIRPDRTGGNRLESVVDDRFYVVGDWVDEYCDLTLDKYLSLTDKSQLKEIRTPVTMEELVGEMNRLDENNKIRPEKARITAVDGRFKKTGGRFEKIGIFGARS